MKGDTTDLVTLSFPEKTKHFLENYDRKSLQGNNWSDFKNFFSLLGEHNNIAIDPEDITERTVRGFVESIYGNFSYCYRESSLNHGNGDTFCIDRIDERIVLGS